MTAVSSPFHGRRHAMCGLTAACLLTLASVTATASGASFQLSKLDASIPQAQGGRCALCDAELRTGEDEGDHVQPLHSTVASQPQTFRLLCIQCHQTVSDPAARREAGILQSHFKRSSVNSFKMLELLMQRLKPLLWRAAVKGARSTWKSSGGKWKKKLPGTMISSGSAMM